MMQVLQGQPDDATKTQQMQQYSYNEQILRQNIMNLQQYIQEQQALFEQQQKTSFLEQQKIDAEYAKWKQTQGGEIINGFEGVVEEK